MSSHLLDMQLSIKVNDVELELLDAFIATMTRRTGIVLNRSSAARTLMNLGHLHANGNGFVVIKGEPGEVGGSERRPEGGKVT
jgi:hypothetical protein